MMEGADDVEMIYNFKETTDKYLLENLIKSVTDVEKINFKFKIHNDNLYIERGLIQLHIAKLK